MHANREPEQGGRASARGVGGLLCAGVSRWPEAARARPPACAYARTHACLKQCSCRRCCSSKHAPDSPMLAFMVPTTEPRLLGQFRTCRSQQGHKRSGCRLVFTSSRRCRHCACYAAFILWRITQRQYGGGSEPHIGDKDGCVAPGAAVCGHRCQRHQLPEAGLEQPAEGRQRHVDLRC